MLELKPISRDAIPQALVKAERYRLLNEPAQAESICLDVLAVDPSNQEARVLYILALTDQFGPHEPAVISRAEEAAAELDDEYARAYYAGIICERRAAGQLAQGGHGSVETAHEWLKDALDCFDRAEALRPAGNDDALLRWNACVRMLERHPDPSGDDDRDSRLLMLE